MAAAAASAVAPSSGFELKVWPPAPPTPAGKVARAVLVNDVSVAKGLAGAAVPGDLLLLLLPAQQSITNSRVTRRSRRCFLVQTFQLSVLLPESAHLWL